MLKKIILLIICLLPMQVYCEQDVDVKTISIDDASQMLNIDGKYNLDFSESFPNLEKIIINSNDLNFLLTFFNQFEDDLGLSNNINLRSIEAYDQFIHVIERAELPQLSSLDLKFIRYENQGVFKFVTKFPLLKQLSIDGVNRIGVESVLYNLIDHENLEILNLHFRDFWKRSGNRNGYHHYPNIGPNIGMEYILSCISGLKELKIKYTANEFEGTSRIPGMLEGLQNRYKARNPDTEVEMLFFNKVD